MRPTRRQAIRASVGSLCAVALANHQRRLDAKEASSTKMRPLDYGRSFITHAAAFNAVRFWVESRTRIFDSQTGSHRDYYQCASCKSEHTFAKKGLFNEDNYDFLPIVSGEDLLVFRRHARLTDSYRDVAKTTRYWGPPTLKVRTAPRVKELENWESIRNATAAATPIVAQTEISHADTGLRAIIEYPVKTMNISLDKKLFQVDTGPIAYPDLTKRQTPEITALSLAFVAFNAPDFADFVVEQPTPVVEEGEEKCQIFHYSSPFSLPARNRLLALED